MAEAIDIDVRIQRIEQLFDRLDPAPFREKALDREFESYLRDCIAEYPSDVPRRLVLHAPPELLHRAHDVSDAVHAHFAFTLQQAQRRARGHRRQHVRIVVVGMAVLVGALILRHLLEASSAAVSAILSEGLLVLGWVALWRPIETLLFERRAQRDELRQLALLAAIDVQWREAAQERVG